MGLEIANYINDLVATNPTGADGKSAGDDHIRLMKATIKATFPGLAGQAFRIQSKSSNYSLVSTDNLSIIECTAAITISTAAAIATLLNGFTVIVLNHSAGNITFDPNGAETINGAILTSVLIPPGSFGVITAGASTWSAMIPQDSRVIGTISGNTTLTAVHANCTFVVNSAATITLPLTTTCFVGDKIKFKNYTSGRAVTIQRQSSDTIDGTISFTLAAFCAVEVEVTSGGLWNITELPTAWVGDIAWRSATSINLGWQACDGSNISQTTFDGLFNVIGVSFGNPGGGNFTVPNLKGRSPLGVGQGNTAFGGGAGTNFTIASASGAETHTLDITQIPAHTHTVAHQGSGNYSAGGNTPLDNPGSPNVNSGSAGSGLTHNNLHPYLVLQPMVKL